MNNCLKIGRLLSRYLDNETSADETLLIKGHIAGCTNCANELAQLSNIKGIIISKERKSLPENYLINRLNNQIAQEESEQKRFSWLFDFSELSRKLIPIPVSVIMLSIVIMLFTSSQASSEISLEDQMLQGNPVTQEMALELILES